MSSQNIGKIIGIVFGVVLVLIFVIGGIIFFSKDKLTSEIIFGTLGVLAGIGCIVVGIRFLKNKGILSKIKEFNTKFNTKSNKISLVKLLVIFMFFYSSAVASLNYQVEPSYSNTLKNISKNLMLNFANNNPSPSTFDNIVQNGLNTNEVIKDGPNTFILSDDNNNNKTDINLYKGGFKVALIIILILLALIIHTIRNTSLPHSKKVIIGLFLGLLLLPIVLSFSLPISFKDFSSSMDSIFTLNPSNTNCNVNPEKKKEKVFKNFIIIVSFFIMFFLSAKYFMEYNNYGSVLHDWIKKDFSGISFIMILFIFFKVFWLFINLKKKIDTKLYGENNDNLVLTGTSQNNASKIYEYLYGIVSEENKSYLFRMVFFISLLFIMMFVYYLVNNYGFSLENHLSTKLNKLQNPKLNLLYPVIFGIFSIINLGYAFSL